MAHVAIFGDSIAGAHWDPQGGWTGRLQRLLNMIVIESDFEAYFAVMNFSLPGETTESIQNRLGGEISALTGDFSEPRVALLALGTNDSMISASTGTHSVSQKLFRTFYRQMIENIRAIDWQPTVVGLPPVDDALVDPIPWLSEWAYRDSEIIAYNTILSELAQEMEVDMIDVYTPLKNKGVDAVLSDGVHPNELGHSLIFQEVRQHFLDAGMIY